MFNILFSKNHAVYGTMWKNTVLPDTPQKTILLTRIACRIPKATNTHTLTICNIYCFSTATQVARTGLNVTL